MHINLQKSKLYEPGLKPCGAVPTLCCSPARRGRTAKSALGSLDDKQMTPT